MIIYIKEHYIQNFLYWDIKFKNIPNYFDKGKICFSFNEVEEYLNENINNNYNHDYTLYAHTGIYMKKFLNDYFKNKYQNIKG